MAKVWKQNECIANNNPFPRLFATIYVAKKFIRNNFKKRVKSSSNLMRIVAKEETETMNQDGQKKKADV